MYVWHMQFLYLELTTRLTFWAYLQLEKMVSAAKEMESTRNTVVRADTGFVLNS